MTPTTAYVVVFDGFADWEPALALCGINSYRGLQAISVGLTPDMVTSMGGLRVVPHITLEQIDMKDALVFILPGGDMWEQGTPGALPALLKRLHTARIPIAAICGATLALARTGLLAGVRHTSNSKDFLLSHVPDYAGAEHYVDTMAVRDGHLITANGVGFIEFAREIALAINLYSEVEAAGWFQLFKHGTMPTLAKE